MTTSPPSPSALPPGRLLVLAMPDGQQVVVLLAGEADLAVASRLRDGIVDCLVYRPRSLVVDATDLTFCDLHGLDALLDAVAVAERSGVAVTIRPSAQLAWLMTTVQQAPGPADSRAMTRPAVRSDVRRGERPDDSLVAGSSRAVLDHGRRGDLPVDDGA